MRKIEKERAKKKRRKAAENAAEGEAPAEEEERAGERAEERAGVRVISTRMYGCFKLSFCFRLEKLLKGGDLCSRTWTKEATL
ncbi:MAG: hypothetical protein M1822_008363 [Bathelium mastoideum]|nr:MAG: hypothetical protein M1822_008363 [Bathelium mastoideum]